MSKDVKRRNSKQLRLTTPDLVVLSLLCEQPMHGYEINQELERRDVQDWAGVSRAQVYYSLNKLKSIEMIQETSGSASVDGPERQEYRTTAKGRKNLGTSLADADWARHRTISPFLTWLALSSHADKITIAAVIQQRRAFLERELVREEVTLQSFANETGEMLIPAMLMVELTIEQFKLELQWLKKVEKLLT